MTDKNLKLKNASREKEIIGVISMIALLSEKSLAKDWLSPEDEEAWKNL